MIADRKPDATEAEAFRIYDEALALSEVMLGYETDAILADAFVRTAMGHNLFSDVHQPLRTAEEANDDPPPRWGGQLSGIAAGGADFADGAPVSAPSAGATAAGRRVPTTDNGRRSELREALNGSKRAGAPSSSSMPQLPPAMGASALPPANRDFGARLAGTHRR